MRHSLVVLIIALVARAAAAVPVCTASDIVGVDPGCPTQGACTITRDIEVTGRCTLDFGTRSVSVGENRKITVAGSLTFQAGSFTMLPGSFIGGDSASLHVVTSGDVVLRQIDLSGESAAGIAGITAGGSVYLQEPFTAKALSAQGDGGSLLIAAGGDLVTAPGSLIDLRGGNGDNARAGWTSFDIAGKVDLGDLIDVRGRGGEEGSSGTSVGINAGGDIILRGVRGDASSAGYRSPGANVDLHSEGNVRILDSISLRGASTRGSDLGGDGGNLSVTALGNLSIEAPISLDGGFAITSGATDVADGVISFVVPEGRRPTVGTHGSVLPAPGIEVLDGCDSTCKLSNTCPATPTPTLTPTPTDIAVSSATATITPTGTLIALETASPTPPPTVTVVASGTATVTPTVTLIASETAAPTATPPLITCAGDCDASGEVTIDELTRGVSIALEADLLSACPVFDMDGNAEITIDELIQGLNNALNGCRPPGN